ncbi:cysteine-rich receptor-like protein kinase 8 [Silene latifolia]|uniref:cysteine-rich receptor-like protein kinase 8 n=1 Tax=Silene latifolia TaxID=37657 RepID=UPI003D76BD07
MKILISILSILGFYVVKTNSSLAYTCFANCTDSSIYSPNSTYQTNLDTLLSTLTKQAASTGFYKSSIGQNVDQIHAHYLCRGDVSASDCSSCVYQASGTMSGECPFKRSAIIWFDNCMLGYSNLPFSDNAPSRVIGNPKNVSSNEFVAFVKTLENNTNKLAPQVANNTIKYGTKESDVTDSSDKLYSLGQCNPYLTEDDCDRCLKNAIAQLPKMYGARVLQPSCNVRYEFNHFYSEAINTAFFLPNSTNSIVPVTNGKQKRRSHAAVIAAVSIVVGVMLLLLCTYLCIYLQKRRKSRLGFEEITATESLQFDFRTIREATNNFSNDNKLGQGGFGSVYKGRLDNGQEIAVKRLSIDSGQGVEEFKTEVLLVAKLQHKNLVRLLGFCIHSNEKLLIYELLPNSSLDKVLLDPSKPTPLGWEERYMILAGVARGLLYLHEDSRLKIIHRDLKSSNILLDQSMNPKIADFGLARLVGTDQVQAVTSKIMGTYGYMPPEYTRTGRFSVKTDVYSFGIIILEVLSGHKCNSTLFPYEEESLVQRAWRLWTEGTGTDLVDDRLDGSFSSEEVTRCIHISLLCIQEEANKRPTMAPIVSALNGHLVEFPEPEPPQEPVRTVYSSGQSSAVTTTAESNQSRGREYSSHDTKNMDDITELYPR